MSSEYDKSILGYYLVLVFVVLSRGTLFVVQRMMNRKGARLLDCYYIVWCQLSPPQRTSKGNCINRVQGSDDDYFDILCEIP
jgi:hypothetical protein